MVTITDNTLRIRQIEYVKMVCRENQLASLTPGEIAKVSIALQKGVSVYEALAIVRP